MVMLTENARAYPYKLQAEAAHCALQSLLTQYRSFIAQGINL
jgi:hypothetical protein